MSAEKLTIVQKNNITPFTTLEKSSVKTKTRVNINELIARVKNKQRKENKQNLIWLLSLTTFVAIIGIISAY
jgi:hypothetical protein